MPVAITDKFPKHWFGTIKFLSCSCNCPVQTCRSLLHAATQEAQAPSILWLHLPLSPWSLPHSAGGWRKTIRISGRVSQLNFMGKCEPRKEETERILAGSPGASSMIFSKWLSTNILNKWTLGFLEIYGLHILINNVWTSHAFQKEGKLRSYIVGYPIWVIWIQKKHECFCDIVKTAGFKKKVTRKERGGGEDC